MWFICIGIVWRIDKWRLLVFPNARYCDLYLGLCGGLGIWRAIHHYFCRVEVARADTLQLLSVLFGFIFSFGLLRAERRWVRLMLWAYIRSLRCVIA